MGPSSCFPGLLPRLSSFLKCHPGLTKKRVELVPWSTAPTSGPKTAFFAAAMKPASGRRAIATRFPGNGGGRGRGRRQVQRDMRSVTAERSDRAPGCPFTRAEPSHPAPLVQAPPPTAFPRTPGACRRGGRCLLVQPISKCRKQRKVQTVGGLRDVMRRGLGAAGVVASAVSHVGPAAGRRSGLGRRRVLPIGREGHWPTERAQSYQRCGPPAR